MTFPAYKATVHPDEWLNQVQTQCIVNGIRNEREILKLCKLNIDPSIAIPDVSNVTDLVKALRAHPSFNILKNDSKARIDAMKFEGDNTAQFIAEFRGLINSAEIDNPDDVRRRLVNTNAANDFFRNEFVKRVTKTTTIDNMFKIYSDIVADSLKLIKYVVGDPSRKGFEFSTEQLVTIKHVATGRYLSSLEEVNYEAGSQRQIVFCGEKVPNEHSIWFITYEKAPERDDYQVNTVLYDDPIYLNHKKTNSTLSLNDYYKSPVTGQAEVHCYAFIASSLHIARSKQPANSEQSTNSQQSTTTSSMPSYLKTGDSIVIKSENSTYSLDSSGKNIFTIDKRPYQEVVGAKKEVVGSKDHGDVKSDEWRIERYQ